MTTVPPTEPRTTGPIHLGTSPRFPEAVEPKTEIVVYICPTPECANHYAAPTFRPDRSTIEQRQLKRSQEGGGQELTHTRLECPTCRVARGISVERKGFIVTQVVPLDEVLTRTKKREEKS